MKRKPASKKSKKALPAPRGLTWQKARIILHHGKVHGKKLTSTQRRYFGAIFSRLKPKNLTAQQAKAQALKWEKRRNPGPAPKKACDPRHPCDGRCPACQEIRQRLRRIHGKKEKTAYSKEPVKVLPRRRKPGKKVLDPFYEE